MIRTAYLCDYASESAFLDESNRSNTLPERLQGLIWDALILAEKAGTRLFLVSNTLLAHFVVFNALRLQDNDLILDELRFGFGVGQLHYYLFDYRVGTTVGEEEMDGAGNRERGGMGVVRL
ncbi:glycylpeptide N-tetradecanoyltransferase [Aspergillus hancockii]|nr:glycylpeptide N-tetradecanoyltransferase [Aspergillus hancockii]